MDPAADAEAIFWDVKIEDRAQGGDLSLDLHHYIRIKIFTDRGRENYSKVEIGQSGQRHISDIAGRTIKPDGRTLELKNDSIFERDLAKTKGFKVRGKVFTLPNVETGDIIEYRYRETRGNEIVSHMRLYFQRDLPMWNVTYHVKPLNIPYLPYDMRSMAFQLDHPPFKKEADGFYTVSMNDMPAFQEEPDMPPEDNLRAWMLIYYEKGGKTDAAKYWKETGREDFSSFKPRMNPNDEVKRVASEVVSGTADPEEKVARLEAFCRTKIRNLSAEGSRMTAEQRKAVKPNNSPGDTLKQKAGWGSDVNLLFAAMAKGAGFDARMARIPDRSDTFFDATRPLAYFLRAISVAVKVNEKWLFYDPGTPYVERGMLRWQEEGVPALISDPKEGFFASTPFSPPERSTRRRKAVLKLLDSGSLEGSVEYTYTGHAGRALKLQYEGMTPAQREEEWKNTLRERLGEAEISNFEMVDVTDPAKPVVVRHKLTVPAYATRTGKRLLVQPAFFQHNVPPRFTLTTRKWPLYFNYSWAEDDDVTIELPEGWQLDQPIAPSDANLGDVGNYAVRVLKSTDGKILTYKRRFDWGRGAKILIPADSYGPLKKVFDYIQQQDNFTLALKGTADAR